jgi:hypothetical protein
MTDTLRVKCINGETKFFFNIYFDRIICFVSLVFRFCYHLEKAGKFKNQNHSGWICTKYRKICVSNSDAGTRGARGARGATASPPPFGRSVNPTIQIGDGRLSPPITTATPNVFHLPASLSNEKRATNVTFTIVTPRYLVGVFDLRFTQVTPLQCLMSCPFTGPKMFWAGPNFLCHTKNLFTNCGSHNHFVPDKR